MHGVTEKIPWRAFNFGGDAALVRRTEESIMAFGLGPPLGEIDRVDRLSRVAASFSGSAETITYCSQVHGRIVHWSEPGTEPIAEQGEGDALLTTVPGHGVLVWTADCVPILLSGKGVVAAVHSGWRGCAADIVRAVVEEMKRVAEVAPAKLHAALGPAVCGSCYEVGIEVPEALRRFDLDETRWLDGDHVDLRGFLIARLEALGVPADHIETVGGCTVESPVLASYRRDGEAAGRQWSMVFLNEGTTTTETRSHRGAQRGS